VQELRVTHGRPSVEEVAPSRLELEAVWGLHAAIFYLGVRKYIYNMPAEDIDALVDLELKVFLGGVISVLEETKATP
jgi:hypothetical protein